VSTRVPLRGIAALAVVAAFVVGEREATAPRPSAQRAADRETIENAYRANNVGVALLEQFNYSAAADAFRRALRIDPSLPLAHVNLAIALLYVPDLDAAQRETSVALSRLPDDPRPHYVAGLVAREQGRTDDARAAFERVLKIDAHDVGSQVNLGQLLLQQQQFADAIAHFRTALADEPYNVTAAYNLGLALTRAGQRDEGQQAMERSQQLRSSGYGTIFSTNYLEQGRYAEAMPSTGAERDLVDPTVPDVAFAPVTIASANAVTGGSQSVVDVFGGGMTALDFDGDGDQDLFVVGPRGARLLRNDGGTFVDVTRTAGLDALSRSGGLGCIAGDYDNDGRPDLFVIRYGGNVLLHNDGGGRFSDVTSKTGLPQYPFLAISAAFVDLDHDGDLDIVVAGLARVDPASATAANLGPSGDAPPAPMQIIRNDGNGTFTDITSESRITGPFNAIAVVPTDFDNRRDIDLLVVKQSGTPALFKNLRDGTFRDVAGETGLKVDGTVSSVAAGDFNKDDFPDFFFGRPGSAGVFAQSDGRGRFTMIDAPAATAGAVAALFFDYDNDGLLDLLTWNADGPHMFRRIADGWSDVTARALPRASSTPPSVLSSPRALIAADVDDDGDEDLVAIGKSGDVNEWRNGRGNLYKSVRVKLAGRVSNRLGVGSKIELRAGSLRQRIESSASTPAAAPADLLFGLGTRGGADVIRVLWPSGVLQSETPAEGQTTLAARIQLQELDRKPSSCPFLYTWNGMRFEFVTDFLGAGEMGYWEAPGVRNRPDPDEYVRIRDDQLVAKDGKYELRITNELEETMFLDRVQLVAVTHPANVDVFPDEGMVDPPRTFRLFAAADSRAPLRAYDDRGRDLTDGVAEADGRYAGDFSVRAIRGYAEEHTLTLAVDSRQLRPDLLLLTGWTDYAFSSDNVAASQSGLTLQPPRLQARAPHGGWRTIVDDIGIPVGRPQTIVVDLRGRLPADAVGLRLVSNMRIYWDRIRFARAGDVRTLHVERIDAAAATLRSRGFSREIAGAPPQPITYDYEHITTASPWKTMIGAYTREGDVRSLLDRVDDRFVVSAPGDEIALSFDAGGFAPLPAGSKRTYLLYADGFSKEMDLHSASPDSVGPLPFHAMSRYPYPPGEHYPDTAEHRRYQDEFNTRRIFRALPLLEANR